jgi:hypothetical protein
MRARALTTGLQRKKVNGRSIFSVIISLTVHLECRTTKIFSFQLVFYCPTLSTAVVQRVGVIVIGIRALMTKSEPWTLGRCQNGRHMTECVATKYPESQDVHFLPREGFHYERRGGGTAYR